MKIIKWVTLSALLLTAVGIGLLAWRVHSFDTSHLPANYGKVDSRLYLGDGARQPLLVGFGGAEGGNAWASRHWQAQREVFVRQGFAFLAVGYFGLPDTPERLDRISLDAIHAAIMKVAEDPKINAQCIALIGGSRGAELALTLASHYADIKAVVAMAPGSAVFVGDSPAMDTSPFMLHGKPLPFVPLPWAAVPDLLTHDLRPAFEKMLQNQAAVQVAAIPVERIHGPVYFLSGRRDELWPSTRMSDVMMQRLDAHQFAYPHQHDALAGGHAAPLQHFDRIEKFLARHVLNNGPPGCRPSAPAANPHSVLSSSPSSSSLASPGRSSSSS